MSNFPPMVASEKENVNYVKQKRKKDEPKNRTKTAWQLIPLNHHIGITT